MTHPTLVATFHLKGAVEIIHQTDSRQTLTRDGCWTLDPENKVYEKCCWLFVAKPDEHTGRWIIWKHHREYSRSARASGDQASAVRMYTDSKEDPVNEWVDFVHQLQVATEN